MTRLIGFAIAVLGISICCFGVYFGLWVCLVGGIVDAINQFKIEQTDPYTIALCIVRIVFFEIPIVLGFWIGTILAAFGFSIMFDRPKHVVQRYHR